MKNLLLHVLLVIFIATIHSTTVRPLKSRYNSMPSTITTMQQVKETTIHHHPIRPLIMPRTMHPMPLKTTLRSTTLVP